MPGGPGGSSPGPPSLVSEKNKQEIYNKQEINDLNSHSYLALKVLCLHLAVLETLGET